MRSAWWLSYVFTGLHVDDDVRPVWAQLCCFTPYNNMIVVVKSCCHLNGEFKLASKGKVPLMTAYFLILELDCTGSRNARSYAVVDAWTWDMRESVLIEASNEACFDEADRLIWGILVTSQEVVRSIKVILLMLWSIPHHPHHCGSDRQGTVIFFSISPAINLLKLRYYGDWLRKLNNSHILDRIPVLILWQWQNDAAIVISTMVKCVFTGHSQLEGNIERQHENILWI